jgi:hypothetical protein
LGCKKYISASVEEDAGLTVIDTRGQLWMNECKRTLSSCDIDILWTILLSLKHFNDYSSDDKLKGEHYRYHSDEV